MLWLSWSCRIGKIRLLSEDVRRYGRACVPCSSLQGGSYEVVPACSAAFYRPTVY